MKETCGIRMHLVLFGLLLIASAMATARAASGEELLEHSMTVDISEPCVIGTDSRITCWPGLNPFAGSPDARYRSIAKGEGFGFVCAVRSDGEAVCPALPGAINPPPTPPPGPWRMLALEGGEVCGIRENGSLECWGDAPALAAAAPMDGPFLSVAIDWNVGCALRVDGTLACWTTADNDEHLLDPAPIGRFLKVEISSVHACGLRSDGRILCWGADVEGGNQVPEDGDFIDLSVGAYHACGLRLQGTVVCWGGIRAGGPSIRVPSPAGLFTQLASGYQRACGRKADGSIHCWGEDAATHDWMSPGGPPGTQLVMGGDETCMLDADGAVRCLDPASPLAPPAGRYHAMSLGQRSGCGIDAFNRVRCWGEPLPPAPTIPMHSVAVGKSHACALVEDGRILCWGDNAVGQTGVPEGTYRAVAVANDYSCALSQSGTVHCWGNGPTVEGVPVGGDFTRLYAGDRIACAAREYEPPQCWGEVVDPLWYGWAFGDSQTAIGSNFSCILQSHDVYCTGSAPGIPFQPSGSFTAIAASGGTLCMLDLENTVQCVGERPATRAFSRARMGPGLIAAGSRHACGADSTGIVDCWGDDSHDQRDTPPIAATRLASRGNHACATDGNNTLHCWGDGQREGNTPPPGLSARSLALGDFGGCAIGARSTVTCWGWNSNGQATPPTGQFRDIAMGLNHTCGVRDDGTLACWGYEADGQIDAPLGTYRMVDVGERHSCAIADNGRIRCWGLGSEGQTTPPADDGRYRALSSGPFHNCAILVDGRLACWGRNDHGQSTPPSGRFLSVSAGGAHTCAVRDDGTRACWGDNVIGQAPSLVLGPEALPNASGIYGTFYQTRLTVEGTGGYLPRSPVFRVIGGDLPSSEALSEDGLLQLYIDRPSAVYHFTVEVRDTNGFAATRDYALQVGPTADITAPTIGFSISGPMGDNGWYVGDVHVAWSVEDQESGIVDIIGCGDYIENRDFAFSWLSCSARNRAGLQRNELRSFKHDGTPPVIRVWYNPQPAPNENGWFNTSVHLYYDCWDVTSGTTDPCPPDADFLTDGVHVPPWHTVRDKAGNVASTPQTPIRIDTTPPLLDAVMPPSELPIGATHDYHASATDALSGVASVSCTPVDTSPYDGGPGGPERQARCTAIDRAGNAAVISSTYTVVAPAPVVGVNARARRVQADSPRGKGVRLLRRGSGTQHKRAR